MGCKLELIPLVLTAILRVILRACATLFFPTCEKTLGRDAAKHPQAEFFSQMPCAPSHA